MADAKRKSDGRDKGRRRYRSDGTPIWGQRSVDGPGKEKQAVGELYDVFDTLASGLWPDGSAQQKDAGDETDEEDDNGDLEKQIAKEVASMKRPRKEQRFASFQTNTPCVIFISCKPPVNPVQLVVKYVQDVVATGVTNSRYVQRLTPISATCPVNIPEIQSLCRRVVLPFFASEPDKKYSYRIELRLRNHNTLSKSAIIQEVAKCVPEGHKVDLENAEVFILIEVFKSVCG
ncbi:hypothetical protein B0H21DRAFT_725643 [Amylocystis lapponica]|nr:hypothetical protein B0H21DRAFT_725643 [Amylocystis lapponica]